MFNLPTRWGKRWLVVGLGMTGMSCVSFLARRQQVIYAYDTRPNPPGMESLPQNYSDLHTSFETAPMAWLDHIDQLVVSPGLALDLPIIVAARERGLPIVSDIEVFASVWPGKTVAVTGSNGKSTVVTLVHELFNAQGFTSHLAGNIGIPVLTEIEQAAPEDIFVLELSSFQLDITEDLNLEAGCILNVSPDHMDRYATVADYAASKQRIYRHAKRVVASKVDAATWPKDNSNTVLFGLEPGETMISVNGEAILPITELKIFGKHNQLNAQAALAIVAPLGVQPAAMQKVLRTFGGLPHRAQVVEKHNDVLWINDSKGTNVGATIAAIDGFKHDYFGKLILIAGGDGKGADFSELNLAMKDCVRHCVLFGQDKHILAASFNNTPCTIVENLEAAVNLCHDLAQPGDCVLLSPACASLDMFKNFAERGDRFIELVQGLDGVKGAQL